MKISSGIGGLEDLDLKNVKENLCGELELDKPGYQMPDDLYTVCC